MTIVDVEGAAEDLSRLVERAMTGEDVVISRDGVPVARLVRLGDEPLPRRRLGILEGKVRIPDDFDDPLPDEIIAAFEGR